jgi:hypothetical protein
MRRPSLILGSLGLLALLGCTSSNDDGPSYGYLVNAIAVADVDANGLPDILGVVSTDVDGYATEGYVSTRLQRSAGEFQLPPTRFRVGKEPANLTMADVDGDGRPDLVVANAGDGTVTVRLADPAKPGFFLPAAPLTTPGRIPLDVAVGDLNGDGLPDLAVAAGFEVSITMVPTPAPTVVVFYQVMPIAPTPGVVTFASPVSFMVGGSPTAVAAADLNGDGLLDLAVATSANTVSVLLRSGGTFAAAVDYATGVQPMAIKVADINGDDKPDLLTANYGASISPDNQGLSVLIQTAPGTFAAPANYTTGYRATALAVGDLNGDGKPDVVVANSGLEGDPGSVSVLLQTPPAAASPGVFIGAVNYRGTWGPMGVALADMDGDGRPDLVLADGDIVVRLNSPTTPGTFGLPNFFYN